MSKAVDTGSETVDWFVKTNARKDGQIAKNTQKISELYQKHTDQEKILHAVAQVDNELIERQHQLSARIDNLESSTATVETKAIAERAKKEKEDRVFQIVAGVILVGVFISGAALGYLRYTG